jgi:multiple sugar transport system ATP-binding protein
MANIVCAKVDKAYGAVNVIRDFNLEIADHEFVVFLGPSGCGKSTLLRMIAGLEDISGGEVSIAGRVVNDLEPRDRGVAMVFQNYALYPHMTIYDNIAFGLKRMRSTRRRSTVASRRWPERSGWNPIFPASRRNCPVASSSAWRSRVP